MKVVMVAPFAFAPKATVNARTFPIAQALVDRGHEVTILVPPYDNLDDAGKTTEQDGVEIQNLPIRRVNAATPLVSGWRLAELAKHKRPDVVHVFKPVGYAALAGMVLRRTTQLPIVTDTDDWEGTGGWNSINPYPWHWKEFFNLQERWLPRHSSAVTVASRTLETQMWGLGIPPGRVFYVPNCPGKAFLRHRSSVGQQDADRVRRTLGIGDAPMAVYVGHITRGDDLDLALSSMQRVRDHLPQARLVIVGSGDGIDRLRSLAEEMRLGETVIFVGWIEHDKVPAYLAAADAAIYPYRDTLVNRAKCSIKILEYMAMGKAIVTHRVGQNLEYLQHGRSGLLAEPANADEFAEGLLSVLADRELAERLGSEAARRIDRQFDWAQRVKSVEQAYCLAVGGGKGTARQH